jgi:hypothetical protein
LTAYSNPPGSTDDLLKEFSPKYSLAFEEITEKVASISNPELREAQIAELWLTKDRGGMLAEAVQNYRSFQTRVLSGTEGGLFELGRFTYSPNANSGNIIASEEDQSAFTTSSASLNLSIKEADRLYALFEELHKRDALSEVRTLEEQRRDDWEEYIANGGDPDRARREAYDSCLTSLRDANLRVFGSGDLLLKRVSKLFFVDTLSETVLSEIPRSEALNLETQHWRGLPTPKIASNSAELYWVRDDRPAADEQKGPSKDAQAPNEFKGQPEPEQTDGNNLVSPASTENRVDQVHSPASMTRPVRPPELARSWMERPAEP